MELAPKPEAWLVGEAQRLHVSPTEVARQIIEEHASKQMWAEERRERTKALTTKYPTKDHTH